MSDTAVLQCLRAHPWVAHAAPDRNGGVVVRPSSDAVAVRPLGPLRSEHLAHWTEVYAFVYAAARDRHRPDLDLSGWRSSDSGEPIADGHMVEWIDHAVALVLDGDPRTVLELGCGSGLLAHRLLPHVETYLGTDVAAVAVERLQAEQPRGRFVVAGAHEVADDAVTAARTPPGTTRPWRPDRVVLNSITECFPDAAYLEAVVGDALDVVASGGTVVVGDVRNLATLADFARWVETARTSSSPSPGDLERRVAARVAAEEELVCDPRLFHRIAERHRARTGVKVAVAVHAKPFAHDTELTRYRYDVTLTVDPPPAPAPDLIPWATLTGDRVATCADALARSTGTCVTGIPHPFLESRDGRRVSDHDAPPDLATLAAALPAGARLQLATPDARRLAVGRLGAVPVLAGQDGGALANDPLARFVAHRLPEVLGDHLERVLPHIDAPGITVEPEIAVEPESDSTSLEEPS